MKKKNVLFFKNFIETIININNIIYKLIFQKK